MGFASDRFGVAARPMLTSVISATGLFTPKNSISDEELVASFNSYVTRHNANNPGDLIEPSSVEFIERASGSYRVMSCPKALFWTLRSCLALG